MSMHSLPRLVCTVLVLCAALPAAVVAQPKSPPPIEIFFDEANLQSMRLSPSTRWLATVVQPKAGRARLVISDTEDKEAPKVVAQYIDADVTNVNWVGDDWLVFETVDKVARFGRGRYSNLLSVMRTGERTRLLIKRDWDTDFPPPGGQPLEGNHWMVGVGAPRTNEIIVERRVRGATGNWDRSVPLAMNVATLARRELADSPPPDIDSWIFDAKARVRAALSTRNEKTTVHWLDLATAKWRVLAVFPVLEWTYSPLYVDDRDQFLVQHVDDKGYRLVGRLDTTTGKITGAPLVSTPGYSGGVGLFTHESTGAVAGMRVLTDASAEVWLDPYMKAVQSKVDAKLPIGVNLLDCGSCDQPRNVVVFNYSDRNPGEYLLYTPATDKWLRLGSVRPDISPAQMAGVEFHRTQARDGADLPVWITRPAGAGRARPAVVLVHGGPWSRGTEWEWSGAAQFLASRGYVVIEPEFRGSTGYGDKHYRAGWKQWGQAMQDDVTDALRFAVRMGWVDDKRVCIAGASYGGYATLMGLAKDPDLYRCGVAWVAVSDPTLMFSIHWSDISRETKEHTMKQRIGDPEKDAVTLAANSPLKQAARIKAPVLLAFGQLDRRVPLEHGELMREAMVKAGNPPEWVVYDREGHGWRYAENRIDFWTRVEKFLARHLQ